jgi:endonuclease-8
LAEGDTILRAGRRIEGALGGKSVEVAAPNSRGRVTGIEQLDGRRLEKVETRGKNLLLRFGDLVLHSHLGMNGAWHVYRRGASWRKPVGAAWVVLRGSEQEAVQFGGPTLRVVTAAEVRRDPWLSRLGPDILASDFDSGAAVRSLRSASDRDLGDALLDQSLIAGIGNVFKSEACFAARVDPWRRIENLSDLELKRVLLKARESMEAAVAKGRQPRAVYRRAGQPCPACGAPISSRGQGDANRTTYWCPKCQAGSASGLDSEVSR